MVRYRKAWQPCQHWRDASDLAATSAGKTPRPARAPAPLRPGRCPAARRSQCTGSRSPRPATSFRSRDLGGWGKAGWSVFVIVLPFLGVFVYLIARGRKMAERDATDAQAQDEAFRAYVRQAANGNGTADELTKLADLRDRGAISEADFQRGKEKILSRAT
jgi:putative oligomerization/nucleic acid binding protein/phospholipase D-like protein